MTRPEWWTAAILAVIVLATMIVTSIYQDTRRVDENIARLQQEIYIQRGEIRALETQLHKTHVRITVEDLTRYDRYVTDVQEMEK